MAQPAPDGAAGSSDGIGWRPTALRLRQAGKGSWDPPQAGDPTHGSLSVTGQPAGTSACGQGKGSRIWGSGSQRGQIHARPLPCRGSQPTVAEWGRCLQGGWARGVRGGLWNQLRSSRCTQVWAQQGLPAHSLLRASASDPVPWGQSSGRTGNSSCVHTDLGQPQAGLRP